MPDPVKQTVVVTGGSRGIGRELCCAFAKAGARIFFSYVSAPDEADETCRLVAGLGGKADALRADATSEDALAAFFRTVLDETGRVDVLINNAGISRDGLIVRMKPSDWDLVLNTNLRGAFICTKIAAKTMLRQQSGRIINIASVVGASGNPGQANYAAAKAGLIGLTKATARELASRNITVNAIAPGFIETDMTAALDPKAREALLSQIPGGRMGRPEEVAAAALFLASENAGYITGQVIHVNGGLYM